MKIHSSSTHRPSSTALAGLAGALSAGLVLLLSAGTAAAQADPGDRVRVEQGSWLPVPLQDPTEAYLYGEVRFFDEDSLVFEVDDALVRLDLDRVGGSVERGEVDGTRLKRGAFIGGAIGLGVGFGISAETDDQTDLEADRLGNVWVVAAGGVAGVALGAWIGNQFKRYRWVTIHGPFLIRDRAATGSPSPFGFSVRIPVG